MSAAGHPVTDDVDNIVERQVDDALLRMAYGRLQASVLHTVIVACAFVGLMWAHLPQRMLPFWLVALVIVSALRYLLARAFQGAGDTRSRPWRAWFEVGAVFGGAAWATGPVLMLADSGLSGALLLTLTVLSVSGVAVVNMATQWRAMIGFLLAALGPTIVSLALIGQPVQWIAATILSAAMALFMAVGHTTSQTTRAMLRTDIRLARAVDETRAARERAEAASQAKTRFLANMSHELRTPLNAVIGAAQLLRANPADVAQHDYLTEAIERSGHNLLGLIENVLDLARIEAGESEVRLADFDLVACAEAALATTVLAARDKGLRVACVIDPALPIHRHGDEGIVRQLLLNLLGNAVKFTPAGEVVLRIAASDDDDGIVRFRVSDTGIGIDPISLPHVFEPFRQGDDAANRRFGGSGLGLTIVKQRVEALGGTVSVESELGQGACFTLALPLARAEAPAPTRRPLELEVLVFEPDEASAEGLCAQLQRLGCKPLRCADVDALRRALGERPGERKLLIDLDDRGAIDELNLGVGLIDRGDVIGLLSAGREAVASDAVGARLPKPVPLAALERCLRHGDATLVEASRITNAEVDLPHVLVVEDDRLNQAIVAGLLRHGGYRVSLASGGEAALSMLRAECFDAVLMDWQMPDMDGIEVTRRMRDGQAGPAGREVPVIALTANAFAEDREACLAAGMNDFLSKPVLAVHLMAALRRHVRVRAGADVAEGLSS